MRSSPDDSTESRSLLRRIEAGEMSAADQLFARHLPRIRAAVGRRVRNALRPRFDASDVVQEAHSQARRQLSDYIQRRPMAFGRWLIRTAHLRLIDFERAHLRAARRSVRREVPLADDSSLQQLHAAQVTACATPSEVALRQERREIVRHCLFELSDADREIVTLRIFEGLDHSAIAKRMGRSPESTKKQFSRALLRLKQHLRRAGL